MDRSNSSRPVRLYGDDIEGYRYAEVTVSSEKIVVTGRMRDGTAEHNEWDRPDAIARAFAILSAAGQDYQNDIAVKVADYVKLCATDEEWTMAILASA